MSKSNWQRTLTIMFFAQLLSAAGFSISYPFLPLYVAEIGSTTKLSTEFWSGVVIAVQGFTMMLASPIWGALSDRYGRKLMVERAMFGGAIILLLMGFANSAEELALMRATQGLITGTISAANALVAAAAPRERSGFAMSTLQVGLWSGVALGPFIGGPLADAFGFRVPFIVTSILLALAGVLVWLGVEEHFDRSTIVHQQSRGFIGGMRHVVSMPGVLPTYGIRFLSSLTNSIVTPIAPLFVATLVAGEGGIATFIGIVFGVSSAASTLTAVYFGRLGDRTSHRPIVIFCALGAAMAFILQVIVGNTGQFLLLYALAGAATGGLIAGPSALLARYTDAGEEGTVYGLDNSITSGGRAIAPLLGVAVATWFGYRGTFAVTGLLLLALMLLAIFTLPKDKIRHKSTPVVSSDTPVELSPG